jgi:hypothetical protein
MQQLDLFVNGRAVMRDMRAQRQMSMPEAWELLRDMVGEFCVADLTDLAPAVPRATWATALGALCKRGLLLHTRTDHRLVREGVRFYEVVEGKRHAVLLPESSARMRDPEAVWRHRMGGLRYEDYRTRAVGRYGLPPPALRCVEAGS